MESWLDTVPKRVLDFWDAFDQVEPVGEAWRQSADISSMLSQLIGMVAAQAGVSLDAMASDDFMPARFQRSKKKPTTLEVKPAKRDEKAEFLQVAAMLGLSKVVSKNGRNNQRS